MWGHQLRRRKNSTFDGTCNIIPGWEPTLNVVEGSQDPGCKRFPDWNGPDKGEAGEFVELKL